MSSQLPSLPAIRPEAIAIVQNPDPQCCYCWYLLHPDINYPAAWSSTICPEHTAFILAQHAQLRAARLASASQRQM